MCRHSSSSISMSTSSNVCRRLVAATRRPQEMLEGVLLINIPLLRIRCHIFEPQVMNRNLRSIGSVGYVFTAYFLTLGSFACECLVVAD